MTMLNGGELLVRSLREAGVDTIFGLHGAHIDAVFQACMDDDQVTMIDHRHEAAAGHAAEGYARASRKLGVALVTAGGGLTNVITPLTNANKDRTPLLVITGSGPLSGPMGEEETNTLQADVDQIGLAKPVTKWAYRVTKTDHIPRIIAQAMRIAGSGPRGPVLIDIPWDVMSTPVDDETIVKINAPVSSMGGAPVDTDLDAILDIFKNAKRPVIVVGSEAKWAKTDTSLATLAANLGAPVFTDYEALGMLNDLPEEYRGGLLQGLYLFADENAAPDAVLMLGVRFGLTSLHGSGMLIPHTAKTVQVDPDARELGRLQSITLGIQADVGATLYAMAKHSGASEMDRSEWRQQAVGIVEQRRQGAIGLGDSDKPLHPVVASEVVANHVNNDMTLVLDGALTYHWMSEVISKSNPKNFMCHGYLGSMGVGFGTAVGAAYATRNSGQPALLVTGDGAVGYNFTEFDSIVRQNIPLVVVIMNNQSWGATQHFQEILCGPDRVINTPLENGDYSKAAKAFGAAGYLVTSADELDQALTAAFKAKKPACIDVRVRVNASPPEERIMLGMHPFKN